ncbi:SRPBCC family protein [Consotaella aegiceratis]|uniref:SRPBCC family protein n=1 Tax=Consotaella aegiceratis TaxID=3097961 RepID=UPI002F40D914
MSDVLELTQWVDAPPSEVWACLTKPECFKAWWRDTIEFDARDGGDLLEPWVSPAGDGRVTRAQVTAFHPPRGLVMVWADDDWTFDTVVSVWIEPSEGGSEVRIEHQGWLKADDAARQQLIEDHRGGWANHLANLAAHAEAHDARRRGH